MAQKKNHTFINNYNIFLQLLQFFSYFFKINLGSKKLIFFQIKLCEN